MNVLVFGGTRFFGKHLVSSLLTAGHEVTIATRGLTKDSFGDTVKRLITDRTDGKHLKEVFAYKYYDVVYDNLAYSSIDIEHVMEAVRCKRYVMTSSVSVCPLHFQTTEKDFEPEKEPLIWYSDREGISYNMLKRSAETALMKAYPKQNSVLVRFPYVTGEDDYTDRLYFYVCHVLAQSPMYIDNMDSQIGFINAADAGRFLQFLGTDEITGAVNAASRGTISIREIISYVEKKTGYAAVFSESGEAAPYNGTPGFSVSTERAERTGFCFSDLKSWMYDLLDVYIERAEKEVSQK